MQVCSISLSGGFRRRFHYSRDAFTLISVLFLIVLLLLLLVSLGTFLSVTTHGVSSERYAHYAQQSAVFGLQTALGELQQAAGPDQRVTATASLFDGSAVGYPDAASIASVPAGQSSWTGVWSSDSLPITPDTRPQANSSLPYSRYDPSSPQSRASEFVGWLVSGTNAAGQFAMPTSLASAAAPVSSVPSSSGIANYVALVPTTNSSASTAPYTQVQKVMIDQVPGGSRYFAFSVEDEGVKADLSWNQTPDATATAMGTSQTQDVRLSSAPGPDYGQLPTGSPFGTPTYPLSPGNDAFLTNAVPLARDPADLQSILSSALSAQDWSTWLASARPHVTSESRGVLADVQRGGLRRDLSLAFEMDGTSQFGYTQNNGGAAANTGPSNFNQTYGEFVGTATSTTDPLCPADGAVPAMIAYSSGTLAFRERYVYRHQAAANDFQRGPNWHLLRDYYNLYKRVSAGALTARAPYPNVSDWPYATGQGGPSTTDPASFNSFQNLVGGSSTTPMTAEIAAAPTKEPYPNQVHYNFKPLQGSYAPAYLGSQWLYSIVFVPSITPNRDNMYLCADQIFYIWNPYNRVLNVPYYRVNDYNYFPGVFQYTVSPLSSASTSSFTPIPLSGLQFAVLGNVYAEPTTCPGSWYLFPPNLSMPPGAVMAFSPTNSTSGFTLFLNETTVSPGYDFASSSSLTKGFYLAKIPNATAPTSPSGTYTVSQTSGTILSIDTTTFKSATVTLGLDSGGGSQVRIGAFLPSPLDSPSATSITGAHTDKLQNFTAIQACSTTSDGEGSPITYSGTVTSGTVTITGPITPNSKYYFGQMSALAKPTQPPAAQSYPVEVFSHLNPMPLDETEGDGSVSNRVVALTQMFSASVVPSTVNPNSIAAAQALLGAGIPASSTGAACWGSSFTTSGRTSVPLLNIPTSPLLSLEAFNGASINNYEQEPFQPLGNSYPSPYLGPGVLQGPEAGWLSTQPEYNHNTLVDVSWYLNDGLFDRYYLSGIAPPYTTTTGYSSAGTIKDTLTKFFSNNFPAAQANPVLHPYLPPGKTATQAVADLCTLPAAGTVAGFSKLGAYSLIDGAFNVNSTSVPAWTAFLMANKSLPVTYASGTGTDTSAGTPFPSSTSPAGPSGNAWSGFARLSDSQIAQLAAAIVRQVRLRGPFMSLSDFINHRVVTDATGTLGALQAAIQDPAISPAINSSLAAQGATPNYGALTMANKAYFSYPNSPTSPATTATGLPGYLSQANLLLPLAPRLSARSDTFRIRAYGEVRSTTGTPRIVAQAACEAVVQRVPEYVDSSNYPWDEGPPGSTDPNPNLKALSVTNQYLGRRFRIVQFRWLNPNEL